MSHSAPPEVVAQLKQDACERTGVNAATWVVVGVRSMRWTDTSLGVREPGMMYGRVMISGQRVVLRNGDHGDREVIYHTGFSGAFKFSREQAVTQERGLA